MKWLVIGYGNSLRSDDRFGLEVAQAVEAHSHQNSFKVIVTTQLTPDLMCVVSQAAGTIFVDASLDLPNGEIQFIPLASTASLDSLTPSIFSHRLSPQTILGGAQELYHHAPQAWLLTAGVSNLELGEELSPHLKALVPEAVKLILDKIHACSIS